MTLLLGRLRPHLQAAPMPSPSRSVREVCLVGGARSDPRWGSGDRVTVSGRVYRVEPAPVAAHAGEDAPRYVHLSAETRA